MDTTIFTRAEALRAGFTLAQIRHALQSGRWQRERAGVYRADPDDVAPTTDRVGHLLRVRSALRRIRSPLWVSHESAAIAYALPLVTEPSRVCLTGEPHDGTTRLPSRLYKQLRIFPATVPAFQTTTACGLSALTPARTVVDLARRLPIEQSLVTVDAALRRKLCTNDELIAVADSCARWPGIRRAARVLALADSRRESPLESLSAGLFEAHGLEAPTAQRELYDKQGRFLGRVDFFWPRWNIVGEADGRLKYVETSAIPDSSPGDRWHDERERQREIELAGHRVVRWTWRELRTTPGVVVQRVLETMLLSVRDGTATAPLPAVRALRSRLGVAGTLAVLESRSSA